MIGTGGAVIDTGTFSRRATRPLFILDPTPLILDPTPPKKGRKAAMFGKKPPITSVPAPTGPRALQTVRTVRRRLPPTEDLLAQYAALAKQVGLPDAAVLDAQLEAWIRNQGWELLDPTSVHEYMRDVCRRLTQDSPFAWQFKWTALSDYKLPIPIRVLERIAMLNTAFGARAPSFEVTEVFPLERIVSRADPFIRVGLWMGHERFIFDVWDEPGFVG